MEKHQANKHKINKFKAYAPQSTSSVAVKYLYKSCK